MFFSTIIATYNRADLIGQTLESVLAQQADDCEVVVVDDGSTDDTQAVLKTYGDRIRVFTQENKGAGAARNLGIEQARGRYVTLIDSDDLYLPWTLATFRKVIAENNEPAFIASHTKAFTDEPTVEQGPLKAIAYRDYYASSADASWVPLCGVAIRADVLRAVGGMCDKRINYEESDLWLKLGASPGFVRIESPICSARREHAGSVTHDQSRNVAGVKYLIQQERNSAYPGGQDRLRERLEMVTRHVRPLSLACAHDDAWSLYLETVAWHITLGRWRYLFGFPIRRLVK